jgi:hypothetical protein
LAAGQQTGSPAAFYKLQLRQNWSVLKWAAHL